MRATRDLLRRRTHLRHKRAALVAQVHHTKSQDNVPELGKQIAYKAHRHGGAARFEEAAVQKNIEVDLALITSDDDLLRDLARHLVKTAKHHEAHPFSRLHTVPGMGTMLSLVLLYAIHGIARLPRVQDFASSCRLITGSKESGGTRLGTSGPKIGNAPLTWALGAAAALFLRNHPPGQTELARLENKHDQGQALSLLAPQLARAIS